MSEDRILNRGFHNGHEWVVNHNGLGYRCGYVKVEPGHPWHGKRYFDLAVKCHGELTFAEADKPYEKDGPDNGWWVGFDCAHGFDAPDPTLPNDSHRGRSELRMLSDIFDGMISMRPTIKDQEFVEAECRSLCDQAASALVAV